MLLLKELRSCLLTEIILKEKTPIPYLVNTRSAPWDAIAAKVGSWSFLIVQTGLTVLALVVSGISWLALSKTVEQSPELVSHREAEKD